MRSCKIFLGADRVGKSSTIKALYDLISLTEPAEILHFSGPRPRDINPIQQYLDPLQKLIHTKPNAHQIWDRAYYETVFYEKMRRATEVPVEYVKVMEHTLEFLFPGKLDVFLLYLPWEVVEPRHVEELKAGIMPHLSLEFRKAEHIAYYEAMDELRAQSNIRDFWHEVDMTSWQEKTPELAETLYSTYHFGYRRKKSKKANKQG